MNFQLISKIKHIIKKKGQTRNCTFSFEMANEHKKNKRNDKRFKNPTYSLLFLKVIFLKHQ